MVLEGSGVRGHAMYKSSLGPKARNHFSGKRHAGKLARVVWEGGDGKGVICTTSPAPYFIWNGGKAVKPYLSLPYHAANASVSVRRSNRTRGISTISGFAGDI